MIEKLTPTETVRARCAQCLGMKQFNAEAVKDCQGDQATLGSCAFFPYHLGRRIPVKVFRAFCLQCMGGQRDFIADCEIEDCPCYPYRFGKNPALKGKRRLSAGLKVFNENRRDVRKKRQDSILSGQDIGSIVSI